MTAPNSIRPPRNMARLHERRPDNTLILHTAFCFSWSCFGNLGLVLGTRVELRSCRERVEENREYGGVEMDAEWS
jgi:hypothetical protein